MKRLVCVLAVVAAASVSAQDAHVIGYGPTKQGAINSAFQKAIEEVSGTVVLSEKESKKDKLTKNDVGNYSAGYIDKYEITDMRKEKDEFAVEMDVWVRKSLMANHKINSSKNAKDIDGAEISTQYNTFVKDKKEAGNFLGKILQDYPSKAFDIKQEYLDVLVGGARNMVISVQYKMNWNYDYLISMKEALGQIQQNPEYYDLACLCYKSKERIRIVSAKPGKFLASSDMFYFSDLGLAQQVNDKFDSIIRIKSTVYDDDDRPIFSSCFSTDTLWAGRRMDNTYELHGSKYERERLLIDVPANMIGQIKNATKVELSIVPSVQCRGG
jgi:hypothetical protein